MSRTIPIIRFQGNLLVSIQIELSDHLVAELKDEITTEIQRYFPHGLIIEVSGVDILDSYIARSIRDITQVATLMGVRSAIAGLDPSMAITLVEMGLVFDGVPTALNLESAMLLLEEEHEERQDDGEISAEMEESLVREMLRRA